MTGHREERDKEGAAAAMEYLRALRGDDEVLGDESAVTSEIPVVVQDRPYAEVHEVLPEDAGFAGAVAGRSAGGVSVSVAAALSAAAGAQSAPVAAQEWITCPECGTGAMIDPAQRRAEDFCPHCDFPLFWARAAVLAMASDETGASLRRLPGTVGRAATASVACPHCGEPNSPVAVTCVRCGLLMVVAEPEPEPEPEPVYLPEPEPEPEPEPPADTYPMGLVIGLCLAILVLAVGLTLYFQYG